MPGLHAGAMSLFAATLQLQPPLDASLRAKGLSMTLTPTHQLSKYTLVGRMTGPAGTAATAAPVFDIQADQLAGSWTTWIKAAFCIPGVTYPLVKPADSSKHPLVSGSSTVQQMRLKPGQ